MKTTFFLTALALVSFSENSFAACQYVKPYERDGKTVKGYYRGCTDAEKAQRIAAQAKVVTPEQQCRDAGNVWVRQSKTGASAHCRTKADGNLNNNFGAGGKAAKNDSDKDGIPNHLDRDDNNNGISDNGDKVLKDHGIVVVAKPADQAAILREQQARARDLAQKKAAEQAAQAERQRLDRMKREMEARKLREAEAKILAEKTRCLREGHLWIEPKAARAHCRTRADGDKENNFGRAEYAGQSAFERDADKGGVPNYKDGNDKNPYSAAPPRITIARPKTEYREVIVEVNEYNTSASGN